MKTIHKILLASAAAASFTLVGHAGNVMPPRMIDNQIKTVSGVNNDPDLLQYNANGNARTWEQMQSIAMAPNDNSARDPDLLTYPSYYASMPPRMLQQQMELRTTGNNASDRDPNLVGPYYAMTE